MSGCTFEEFHAAAWQRDPFPWQSRLADEVLSRGWPSALDIPTGAGKTAVIDVALYSLACQPERFPRRIVLVVDRRLVVDQAADRARTLSERLTAASDGPLHAVATSLRKLFGGEEADSPLEVAVLRGGMPRRDDWTHRPDRPCVAVSTVDQVGSRLLFRGYGVSASMAPIHAGLLGNDALIVLDEVHLSVPFAETLDAIGKRWRGLGAASLPVRWSVVRMSATLNDGIATQRAFSLSANDRDHPVLSPRLASSKAAELVEVKVRGDETDRRRQLAAMAVTQARKLVEAGSRTVAIVLNRVDAARHAREILADAAHEMDAVLLTGRMRPLDRDRVLATLKPRVLAGRLRDEAAQPLVVVATQCIEAGADFDFDGLVTECASLDALEQRFGRVDRLGELGLTRSVVVVRTDQLTDEEDAVYGPALAATWRWLSSLGEVDFGIARLPREHRPADVLTPRSCAPILLPAHLDTWTQTNPRPWPEPDVSLWLHGPQRESTDVLVAWRADFDPELLNGREDDSALGSLLRQCLDACPPSPAECMPVPINAVRAWLRGELATAEDVADVAARVAGESGSDRTDLAIRWDGEAAEAVRAEQIRPGDLLIVPASRGGVRFENWAPASDAVVRDLGDVASMGRDPVLRLHPGSLASWDIPADLRARVPQPSSNADGEPDVEIAAWLDEIGGRDPALDVLIRALGPKPRCIAMGAHWVLRPRKRSGRAVSSTGDDSGSFLGREVRLDEHSEDVRTLVATFGRRIGFSEDVVDDLALAAWLHDVGKADPRFQKMLVGGSDVRFSLLDAPLAKSRMDTHDAAARDEARTRAGLPRGFRHELLSMALACTAGALDAAHDRDLVLHLIASHHGHCRPFAPAIEEDVGIDVTVRHGEAALTASSRHGLQRLDSDVADRFWRLVRRYGWWGLAWLEATLRLADHRASEAATGRSS